MTDGTVGVRLARNLGLYLAGVGLATAGALGMAAAIELDQWLAAALFVLGIAVVLTVHEWLGGPI